jgi:hypothetical protein
MSMNDPEFYPELMPYQEQILKMLQCAHKLIVYPKMNHSKSMALAMELASDLNMVYTDSNLEMIRNATAVDVFDRMTANGYKLCLITGIYYK